MVGEPLREGGDDDEVSLRESLRRTLYRPGASREDIEQYECHLPQSDSDVFITGRSVPTNGTAGRETGIQRRGRRPSWVILAVVGVAACAGAGLALTTSRGESSRLDGTSAVASTKATKSSKAEHPLAHDDGAQPYATGSALTDGRGRFAYTAKLGDTVIGIASRFHVCISDVLGGFPLSAQGHQLTSGLPLTIELGPWPVLTDGTIDCVDDKIAS